MHSLLKVKKIYAASFVPAAFSKKKKIESEICTASFVPAAFSRKKKAGSEIIISYLNK